VTEPVALQAASARSAAVDASPIRVAAEAEPALAQTALEPATGPEPVTVAAAHRAHANAASIWALSGRLVWSQLARSGAQALRLYGALAQSALGWQCAALRGLANGGRGTGSAFRSEGDSS
jgi:hypothetical protein